MQLVAATLRLHKSQTAVIFQSLAQKEIEEGEDAGAVGEKQNHAFRSTGRLSKCRESLKIIFRGLI